MESQASENPRVVVIAGPNGSGKSSLIASLRADPAFAFPSDYINADEIARSLQVEDRETRERTAFYKAEAERVRLSRARATFAFETVFSHPSKILFLNRLKLDGYHVTVYYLLTSHPRINLERVKQRVREGGHPVAAGKIRSRYARCRQIFPRVMETADEAFFIDASTLPPAPGFALHTGRLIRFSELSPWADQSLAMLLLERQKEREALLRGFPELEAANELDGSYVGRLVRVTANYLVQEVTGTHGEKRLIRHDRCLLLGAYPVLVANESLNMNYQDGWAAAKPI